MKCFWIGDGRWRMTSIALIVWVQESTRRGSTSLGLVLSTGEVRSEVELLKMLWGLADDRHEKTGSLRTMKRSV